MTSIVSCGLYTFMVFVLTSPFLLALPSRKSYCNCRPWKASPIICFESFVLRDVLIFSVLVPCLLSLTLCPGWYHQVFAYSVDAVPAIKISYMVPTWLSASARSSLNSRSHKFCLGRTEILAALVFSWEEQRGGISFIDYTLGQRSPLRVQATSLRQLHSWRAAEVLLRLVMVYFKHLCGTVSSRLAIPRMGSNSDPMPSPAKMSFQYNSEVQSD